MKFSTETINRIQMLMVAEFVEQMEREEIKAKELEQAVWSSLQEIGKNSYGEMLTKMDEQQQGVEAECQCGAVGKRVSKRGAQVLSVFGWSNYRRSYYQCPACRHRWVALDEKHGLRAGRATELMSGLLGLAGITVSFDEARRQIKQYLQVDVSANTIRQETQRIGEKQDKREQAWITQSQDLAYLQERERQPERPKLLYGSIDGAFYAFIKYSFTDKSSTDVAKDILLKANVCVIPGTAFGKTAEGYLRITFARSIEEIKEAFKRIRRYIKEIS